MAFGLFSRFARLVALLGVMGVCGWAWAGERFGMDLRQKPDGLGLGVYDIAVVRGDARLDLEALHAVGTKCLAEVDVRDVAVGSKAERRAQELGVPLKQSGRDGMVRMDVLSPDWVTVAARELLAPAVERGFSGLVLTGLGTVTGEAEIAAVSQGLGLFRAMFPDKELVLKDAPVLAAGAGHHLNGVLITTGGVEAQIREAMRVGLKALVVEVVTNVEPEALKKRAGVIEAAGGLPFFTKDLQGGVNLGPLREVRRRVLVLHSGPIDESFTATVLHGTLQWLGYQVEYREGLAAAEGAGDVDGVIVDQTLKLTAAEQVQLTKTVAGWREQKVRMLLTGMPWESAEAVADAGRILGWQGSGARIQPVRKPAFAKLEGAALMQSGAVTPRTGDFRDLTAPADARVLVAVRPGREAAAVRFDAVYLAEWGGVWLDSLAPVAGPQVAPRYFLEQWLGADAATPVMDVASQNGNRLLVTHIGSEGFTALSSTQGLPLAAEAMLERVLKRYPIPFSVALCEGDIRGWTLQSEPRDALRYVEAARAIMALPQVEAASGSLSRPNNWNGEDFEPGPLDSGDKNLRVTLEREVAGSLAFIHRELLPEGKRVQAMIWPRGSAPGVDAVTFARRMGVESYECRPSAMLTGGLAPMPPHSWGTGNQLRVVGIDPRGPRLDADAWIAHAEGGDAKASNGALQLALTFEDAASDHALREVEKVLGWCMKQPLQAMPAGAYAALVADAADTRVHEAGPNHWVIVNRGRARTVRLPVSSGVPDMENSQGVAGYAVHGGHLYVHTLGRRRTELVLQAGPKPGQLRFAEASGALEFIESTGLRTAFRVIESRPVKVRFEGLKRGTVCLMRTENASQHLTADAEGRISFTAPGGTLVQLQLVPTQNAALR